MSLNLGQRPLRPCYSGPILGLGSNRKGTSSNGLFFFNILFIFLLKETIAITSFQCKCYFFNTIFNTHTQKMLNLMLNLNLYSNAHNVI